MRTVFFCFVTFLAGVTAFGADIVYVEAESFADLGGWVIDQQSIEAMGSPYLLAHGLGEPVKDATTTVEIPRAGTYRVFVRTKDWVARWGAPKAPGRFRLLVNGEPLAPTFGTQGKDWFWHDGGSVVLAAGPATLTLHDLTGFEGRCDAILLTDDPDFVPPGEKDAIGALSKKARNVAATPETVGEYDVVVVGGGVAGCCSAVSAARLGLSVALIQNRPVLGGNSSSEIRVWIKGEVHQQPYPVLGEIVAEMDTKPDASPGPDASIYGDDVKLQVVKAEKNLDLFLCEHVDQVEMKDGRIVAVVSRNIASGKESRYVGRWFVDCTGDGTVGFLAGADWEMTETGHMGSSNLWRPEETRGPSPFPRIEWGIDVTGKPYPDKLPQLGVWFWESGFDLDTIHDAEAIRDHNLRAMYSVWDDLKNNKKLYPNHKIIWAAYVSGKRESRRLLGDYIATKEDVMEHRLFPDSLVTCTWSIDLHVPKEPDIEASPDNPFISRAIFIRPEKPFVVPYRCFYSRNVPNLFMAGRNISVTHDALGTTRVQGTNGMMGEVIGRAAFLCKKHGLDPRGVYEERLEELIGLCEQSTK